MKTDQFVIANKSTIGISSAIVLIGLISSIIYVSSQRKSVAAELASTQLAFASSTSSFEFKVKDLQDQLAAGAKQYAHALTLLDESQKKALNLEDIKRINEQAISNLTKLTTFDTELIKKYSKVYFLSENYVPAKLVDVNTKFIVDLTKPVQGLDGVVVNLEKMITDADTANIPLKVLSGYRSFGYQKSLKAEYKIVYGAGTANQFSAEQGYSEHQLGTAFDFTTPALKGAYTEFENTTAFTWLNENAYKYGFVLSYPKANTFYVYEPWHWRYVGKVLAKNLRATNRYYYELDQREIDNFLVNFFD